MLGDFMNLYVQMSDAEYEAFKKFKEKPNLDDHDSAALAAALLKVMQKEGGTVDSHNSMYELDPTNRKTTTLAKLRNKNFIITLSVERY